MKRFFLKRWKQVIAFTGLLFLFSSGIYAALPQFVEVKGGSPVSGIYEIQGTHGYFSHHYWKRADGAYYLYSDKCATFDNNNYWNLGTTLDDGTSAYTFAVSYAGQSVETNDALMATVVSPDMLTSWNSVDGFTITVSIYSGVSSPEIYIRGNGSDIFDGNTGTSFFNHTKFGSQNISSGSIIRTYSIYNEGTATLNISGITVTPGVGFTASAPASSTIVASSSTTFTVTFDPSSNGVKTATVTVTNDDSDEGVYNFAIDGYGHTPENLGVTGITSPSAANTLYIHQGVLNGFEYWKSADNYFLYNDGSTWNIDNDQNSTSLFFYSANNSSSSSILDVTSWTGSPGSGATGTGIPVISTATATPNINIKGNSTTIAINDNTPSFSDFTKFGSADISAVDATGSRIRTYTIENTGGASLTSLAVTISGTDAADFSKTDPLSPTIAAYGSTTFTVTFNPLTTSGTKTATVSIASNDPDENPYTFTISGDAFTPKSLIVSNITTPSTAEGTYIYQGILNEFQYWKHQSQNYYIYNDLYENNHWWYIDTDQSSVTLSDFLFTQNSDAAAPVGLSGWTLGSGAVGTPTIVYAGPEIEVRGNSILINDGDLSPTTTDYTDFGSVVAGTGTISRTYTIHNIGYETLNLNGLPLIVAKSGTNADDFTIIQPTSSTLTALTGTITFTVVFNPSGAGTRTAELSIASDDSDENPYTFAIQGTGLTPTLPEWSVTGNYALKFDGNSSVTAPLDDDNFTAFSIEAWVKWDPATGNEVEFICGKAFEQMEIHTIPGNGIRFIPTTGVYLDASGVLPAGVWTHIAATYQPSVSSAHLYINGQEVSLTNKGSRLVGEPLQNTSADFQIGRRIIVETPYYFNGSIDELRIWNTLLSESQIKAGMYRSPGSTAGLVANYRMSDGSGATLSDNSGNGNNGTIQGAAWAASGAFAGPRQALDFDGTDDYISIPDHDLLDMGTGDFTYEFWVKKSGSNDVRYDIISKEATTGDNDLSILINESNKAVIYTEETTISHSVVSNITIPTGVWTHIAGVRYGTSLKVYINGVLDNTSIGTVQNISNSNALILAANYNGIGNTGFLNGQLDEVRIWNVARTETEIKETMTRNLAGDETGLVAYYRMDHNDGTVLYDHSANGHDGTLTNMDNTDWVPSSAFNTWLGTESSNWATAANWSNSVPAATDNVGLYKWNLGSEATVSNTPTVNNLLVSAGSAPTFSSNFTVNGNLLLEKNMNLNGQVVTIGENGYLVEGNGFFSGASGSITTTRDLSNLTAQNVGGLGAVITTAADLGTTTIVRKHSASPVWGGNSIFRYYEISPSTNTGLDALLVIKYREEELNSNTETELQLCKTTDNGLTWSAEGGTVDAGNNSIALSGINSFSGWSATSATDCANPTTGGEIASDQEICYNSAPETLTSAMLPTGHYGTLEYKWQYSTTGETSGFIDIAGSSEASLSPGALTETTWFKRLARVTCSSDWAGAVESNVVKITIEETAPILTLPNNIIVYSDADECGKVVNYIEETADVVQPDYNLGTAGSDHWQSFKAGETGKFTKLQLSHNNYSELSFTFDVYEGNGVSGEKIFTKDYDFGTIGSGWIDIVLPADEAPWLIAGSTYTFRIRGVGTIFSCYSPKNYTDGTYYSSSYGYPDWNLRFKTYVTTGVFGSDNCGEVIITQTEGLTNGSVFPAGTTTNTFLVTDQAGNTAQGSFTVTVVDTIFPALSVQDITVYLDENGSAVIDANDLVTAASDNCSLLDTTVSVSEFSCSDVGDPVEVTVTLRDTQENSVSKTARVTVLDTLLPVIHCIPDTTVYTFRQAKVYDNNSQDFVKDSNAHNFSFSDPTPAGAEIVNISIVMNIYYPYLSAYADNKVYLNGNLFGEKVVGSPAGNKTYTLSKTNPVYVKGGNNTLRLNSYWNYVDFKSTVIIIEYRLGSECSQVISLTPPVVDENCAFSIVNNYNHSTDASGIYPVGTTPVSWAVTDASGNTATCLQNVTVVDNTPPVVMCKDVTVSLDGEGNGAVSAIQINNGSTDNCGIDTMQLNITDFSCADIGNNPVILTVTDVNGNSSSCTATVTVLDTIYPVALCKPVTVYLDASGSVTIAEDLVDNNSTDVCNLLFDTDFTTFSCSDILELNTVTLTVTDPGGNSSTCSAIVTVLDTISPTVFSKNIQVVLDEYGAASITPADIDKGSSDACGITGMQLDVSDFDCSHAAELTPAVHFPGTGYLQVSGNSPLNFSSSTSFTFEAWINPVSEGHLFGKRQTYNGTTAIYSRVNTDGSITFGIDDYNSEGWLWINSPANTVLFDHWSHVALVYNHTTKAMNIVVNGIVVGSGVLNKTSSSSTGNIYIGAGRDGSDNFNGMMDEVRIWTKARTTAEINSAMGVNLAPSSSGLVCYYSFDNDTQGLYANSLASGAYAGFAGGLTLSAWTNSGFPKEYQEVILSVTDLYGNTGRAVAKVFVVDQMNPVALCKDVTVQLDENGTGSITAEAVNNGSNDACGIQSLSLSQSSFDCSEVGINTVTLTVTDNNSNTSSCSATVTVQDNVAPSLSIHDITVYLDEEGSASITKADLVTAAFDNCAVLDTVISVSTFGCSNTGNNEVMVTLRDVNGNQMEGIVIVTVLDEILPVAVCKDVTLFLDETGHATLTPEEVDGGSGDNCENTSLAVNLTDFDCNYLGENTVILTVTDNSGSTASCIAGVTVVDILPPQIDTIPDVEVVVAAGVCETTIDYPHPYVYDNCEITLELLSGLGENGVFPVGTTTETWVATDKWDNSDTLSFNVTVTAPNAAPTIGTIADVTVDEGSAPFTVELTGISWGTDCNAQEVTVIAESSNAGLASVTTSYSEGVTGSLELAITPEMTGEAEITVTVTDSEGATATTTFKVVVTVVNHAPVLVTPIADQTVNASFVLKVPVPAGMFADADGDKLQVEVFLQDHDTLPEWAVFTGDTIYFTPMIADTGCYYMVVKATDPEGAFATDTFHVCVEGYPVSAGEIAAGGFGVNMYPNPTRGDVTIGISTGFHNVELTVSDIAGRAVLRKQYTMVERITFDMADKVSGMYLVTLDIDGERIVKKLVVDRK